MKKFRSLTRSEARSVRGRIPLILLWLVGVPVPILVLIFLFRGCS
ncbi:MAG TPA: hypothetical protein VIM58_09655 [Candidatus Methylacidiphilales bacterium]